MHWKAPLQRWCLYGSLLEIQQTVSSWTQWESCLCPPTPEFKTYEGRTQRLTWHDRNKEDRMAMASGLCFHDTRIYVCAYLLTYSLTHSLTYLLTYLLTSITYLLTCSRILLTYWFAYFLTYFLLGSKIDSNPYRSPSWTLSKSLVSSCDSSLVASICSAKSGVTCHSSYRSYPNWFET